MELKEVQKLLGGRLGLRVKQDCDGILIYANAWTLVVDVYKWIKNFFLKNVGKLKDL